MRLNVVEVFDSIQGEGEWMGTYCTFIRLPGCNFACPFCDTDFSKASKKLDTDKQKMQQHVVITGGEPTIHPRFVELCKDLQEKGHEVHVETNGTHIDIIPEEVWITCSPKDPDWMKKPSHVVDWKVNMDRIDEFKLVVDSSFEPDFWVAAIISPVWLQPCDGPHLKESKERILTLVKTFPETFKAGIQLHKYYGAV